MNYYCNKFQSRRISSMIYYDFQCGLNQQESGQRIQSAFCDESPYHISVFTWLSEFRRKRDHLHDDVRKSVPTGVIEFDVETNNKYFFLFLF